MNHLFLINKKEYFIKKVISVLMMIMLIFLLVSCVPGEDFSSNSSAPEEKNSSTRAEFSSESEISTSPDSSGLEVSDNSDETSDDASNKEVKTVFTFRVNENMPIYECIFVRNNSGPNIMFLNDDDTESGYFNKIIINDESGNQIQIISLSDFSGTSNLMFNFFDINSEGNMDLTLQQFAADKVYSYNYIWDDIKNKYNEVPESKVYKVL